MSLIAPGIEASISNSTMWLEEEDPIASNLQMDKWYHIRIDIDVPARDYDVYVYDVNAVGGNLQRGNLIASALGLPAYGTLMSKVSHIGFATWNDGPGTFYVDNVREYVP